MINTKRRDKKDEKKKRDYERKYEGKMRGEKRERIVGERVWKNSAYIFENSFNSLQLKRK